MINGNMTTCDELTGSDPCNPSGHLFAPVKSVGFLPFLPPVTSGKAVPAVTSFHCCRYYFQASLGYSDGNTFSGFNPGFFRPIV